VDGLLLPKSDNTYVDGHLTLKANQLTTYTKVEVDGLVSPKADKTYVDGQVALKANQLTTHQNRGRYSIRTQGKSIKHIHQNRGRWSSITQVQQDLC
ncbi:MAG: hypothetical protein ACKPKO_17290, partial [Candidatus Fonsibacter sp.]